MLWKNVVSSGVVPGNGGGPGAVPPGMTMPGQAPSAP
jgi:hypothetical protein